MKKLLGLTKLRDSTRISYAGVAVFIILVLILSGCISPESKIGKLLSANSIDQAKVEVNSMLSSGDITSEEAFALRRNIASAEIDYLRRYDEPTDNNLREQVKFARKIKQISEIYDIEIPSKYYDFEKVEFEFLFGIDKSVQALNSKKYAEFILLMGRHGRTLEYYPDERFQVESRVNTIKSEFLRQYLLLTCCDHSSTKVDINSLDSLLGKYKENPFLGKLKEYVLYDRMSDIELPIGVIVDGGSDGKKHAEEVLKSKLSLVFPFNVKTQEIGQHKNSLILRFGIYDSDLDVQRTNSRKVSSRYKTGTRQVSNPAYSNAYLEYQRTQAEANRIVSQANADRIANANNPYYLDLWGFAIGAANGNARTALNNLQNTPQYRTENIYNSYSYDTSDVTYALKTKWRAKLYFPRYGYSYSLAGAKSSQKSGVEQRGMHDDDENRYRHNYLTSAGAENLIDEQLSEIASEIIYTNLGVLHSWDNDSKTKNSEFEKYFSLLVKNQTDNKLLSFALDDTVFRPLQPKLRKAKLNNFLAKAIVSPVPNTLTKKKAGSISADSGYQQQTVSKIYNNAVQSVVTILTEDGQGTGFVVSDKAILTNYHVIKGNSIVQLILNDGREILGKIGNFIPNSDIALIHPLRGALPSSLKMSTKRIQVGDPVLAIGSPSGLTGTLTNGIVSSLRNIKGVSYIQSNVAINPGNSGGPLLNMAGEVIGINTSKIIDESVEGLSFSVATEDFINLINQ